MDNSDVAVTLVRGWARAELDAGCVLSPWSEARDRTLQALALYGIDASIIEANEQRIASAWDGAKLAHEAGTSWVARICMELDAARKELASRESQLGTMHRQQQRIFALEREVKDLRNMVHHREAEVSALKKEIAKMKKEPASG